MLGSGRDSQRVLSNAAVVGLVRVMADQSPVQSPMGRGVYVGNRGFTSCFLRTLASFDDNSIRLMADIMPCAARSHDIGGWIKAEGRWRTFSEKKRQQPLLQAPGRSLRPRQGSSLLFRAPHPPIHACSMLWG